MADSVGVVDCLDPRLGTKEFSSVAAASIAELHRRLMTPCATVAEAVSLARRRVREHPGHIAAMAVRLGGVAVFDARREGNDYMERVGWGCNTTEGVSTTLRVSPETAEAAMPAEKAAALIAECRRKAERGGADDD